MREVTDTIPGDLFDELFKPDHRSERLPRVGIDDTDLKVGSVRVATAGSRGSYWTALARPHRAAYQRLRNVRYRTDLRFVEAQSSRLQLNGKRLQWIQQPPWMKAA